MPADHGGSFLMPTPPLAISTPEQFTDEHRAFHAAAVAFAQREVAPVATRLDRKEPGLMRTLLERAGAAGLLGVDIPEALGGLGLDKTTSLLVKEAMVVDGAWSVTHGAHTTIGMLPLAYFGTPAQQTRWMPDLCQGRAVAAYALTEAGSGSDALAARTTAVLEGDHYVLNGTKQWITNAGFADVFTVFAKVDGQAFTAFVVERTDGGVRIGPEEHKMGIRGSSTCELILDGARIPADRVLGQVGRGHRIALGILNVGRMKLGAGGAGASKLALGVAAAFAKERKQFGRAIGSFGLIRHKLARMAARTAAVESAAYRLAGQVDARVGAAAADQAHAPSQQAPGEFAAECSLLKVAGSECLAMVTDEAMQVLGGYGYTEHFPLERMYRDARIHRIFEGTNEINRLVASSTLWRHVQRETLPLAPRLLPSPPPAHPHLAAVEALHGLWMAAALGIREALGAQLEDEQPLAGALADLACELWLMQSLCLRAGQHAGSPPRGALLEALAGLAVWDGLERSLPPARLLAERLDDSGCQLWGKVGDLAAAVPTGRSAMVETVADAVLASQGYPLAW